MSRRRTRSVLPMVLMIVSLVMIGYGGYMSLVDITYDVPVVPPRDKPLVPAPDEPDLPVTTDTIIVRPLPDIEIVSISIFGGDGTINLANIILFVGLVLFVVSFMIRRR